MGEISDLDLTDVNGDGYPDIVTLAVFVDSAAIYYGNGNGGFAGSAHLPLAAGTSDLHMVDIDGDGRQDLLYGTKHYVYMHRQEGQWFSALPRKLIPLNVDLYAPAIAFGDLTGDGRTDLLVDGSLDSKPLLLTYEQDVHGRFSARKRPAWSSVQGVSSLTDMDGDGVTDLLVLQYHIPDAAAIRFGNGNGTFGAETRHALDGSPLAVADFDDDGLVDILSTAEGSRLALHRGSLDAVGGEDLAAGLELESNVVRVSVLNRGDVPSQESWLYFDLRARNGRVVAGAMPSGCWEYTFQDDWVGVECPTPPLGVGSRYDIVLPFGVTSSRRDQVFARAEIFTTGLDTRPANNVQARRTIVMPAKGAKVAPPPGSPRRSP